MIGNLDKSEFVPDENYNDFYAGHKFEPMPESLALNATHIPRVAWALDVAKEIDAENVLDLCCLDGFASLTLGKKLDLDGIGVDLSQPGIKLANQRAEANRIPIEYIQKPIEDLKGQGDFDLVLLFEAIEHFKDVDKVMEVIKAHLKPGGTLLVSTPDAEGVFGISNTEDICHLQVYSHRTKNLPTYKPSSPIVKPVISLPNYLTEQGFTVTETEVWNELVHCRAILERK
jgi:2-polyprenyl-3-methyl-5-hydroxy-6-metoxy-1,4-benzoquinol methylase